jgi:GR25 family glycosyltransferase involved in LPS biosynthesis
MLDVSTVPAYVIHVVGGDRSDNVRSQIAKHAIDSISVFEAYIPETLHRRAPKYYDKWFNRFNTDEYSKRNLCLMMSHLDIIKHARDIDLRYVMVLEDDFNIKDSFLTRKEIHTEFSWLFVGGYFEPEFIQEEVVGGVYRVKKANSSHAYIVNHRIYNFVIEQIENYYDNVPGLMGVDGFFARKVLPFINTLAVVPPIINTIKSPSTLTNGISDHYEYYKRLNRDLNE